MAKSNSRVCQRRRNTAQLVPGNNLNSQDLVGRERPSLRPGSVTKHDESRGRSRSRHAEQSVQRDAKLNLPLQTCQSDENLVGAMRHTMYGPRDGDFRDGLCTKGQPFHSQAKDQDADRVAVELGVIFVVSISLAACTYGCKKRFTGDRSG